MSQFRSTPPQPPHPPQAPRAPQPQQAPQPALRPPAQPSAPAGQSPPKIAPVPMQPVKQEDLEPITLVEEEPSQKSPADGAGASKIRAFAVPGMHRESKYKRQPFVTGRGAIRVRSFHGRLSDEGMAFLDDKINEWLDQHPEIEVKFVTTTIGQFEGKIREPALVLNVWY